MASEFRRAGLVQQLLRLRLHVWGDVFVLTPRFRGTRAFAVVFARRVLRRHTLFLSLKKI
jgi:hypothetical protein